LAAKIQSNVQIIPVESAQARREFLQLPWYIYRNDAKWIPHLIQDVEKVFDPERNKLFRDGEAQRWILKDDSGKTIGRVAAFVNKSYSSGMKQPTGGLGFFECIDDKNAAFQLLDTAIEWLKSRGMKAVDGPINFGEKNMFWGLLIDNFKDPNSYGMSYNPEYYVRLFKDYGFEVYYEQFMYKRDLNVPAQEVFVRKYNLIKADPEYVIRNVRGMSMKQLAEDFLTVYNNAWGGHSGFKKMKAIQAEKVVSALKPVLDPDIVVFVYHQNKPIAFYINIPELNEIFCHVKGNLNLIGKLKFLWHKWRKTPRIMVGIVFGVDREYHGRGIEGAMIKWTEENIVTLKRYDETVLTWIGDFNPKMIHIAENLGAYLYRKMATFRLMLDASIPFERAPMAG
jgi:hypothetical protein